MSKECTFPYPVGTISDCKIVEKRDERFIELIFDQQVKDYSFWTVTDDPSFTVKPMKYPNLEDKLKKNWDGSEYVLFVTNVYYGEMFRLRFLNKSSDRDIWVKTDDPDLKICWKKIKFIFFIFTKFENLKILYF